MTQREIDDAQDALDEETRGKCRECGQPLPKDPATYVYAVKLKLGSGYFRWHYSTLVTKAVAQREARSLKATGYVALSLSTADAAVHRARFGDRRFRK